MSKEIDKKPQKIQVHEQVPRIERDRQHSKQLSERHRELDRQRSENARRGLPQWQFGDEYFVSLAGCDRFSNFFIDIFLEVQDNKYS